jgi:hypothetical protein
VDALFRAHTIEELKVIERNTKFVRLKYAFLCCFSHAPAQTRH